MKKIFDLIVLLCVVFSVSLNASEREKRIEKAIVIEIAGLVVDAGNLKALENAKLYDENGLLIATTDSNGYFTGKVNYSGNGAVHFKIKIEKKGYKSFIQTENWGDVGNHIRSTYYFGITQKDRKISNAFSEMTFNKDFSLDTVITGFKTVKEKIDFKNKLEAAKSNNQHIFFQIGYDYYLINNGGWLKISSPEEQISIDKKRIVKASEINSIIRRNQVKGMSPSTSKDYGYELYTK